MKILMFFLIYVTISSMGALDVWGHLSEDTTWSSDNNPYHVIGDITVESGVTLTILPGTVIEIQSSPLTSWDDFYQYFYYPQYHQSKLFWVEGRISAEGTEQAPILFTHDVEDVNYYWGLIYIKDTADLCSFSYCRFEYSGSMTIQPGNIAKASISLYNGKCRINNNYFYTNVSNITVYSPCKTVEIIDNTFNIASNMGAFPQTFLQERFSIRSPDAGYKPALVAHNTFLNRNESYIQSVDLVFNRFQNHNNDELFVCHGENCIRNIYGNNFINCEIGIEGGNIEDSFFIKNNRFIDGNYGLDLSHGYVDIRDNYFEENSMQTFFNNGIVSNNIYNASHMSAIGDIILSNNIVYNKNGTGFSTGYNPYCSNNISFNNRYAMTGFDVVYENCINLLSQELSFNPISGNPVFRNCIIDFPLEPPLIDGGGNIWLDSLNLDSLFVDWQNSDFHLAPGSIAIDAGFDTLGYYYPFDLEYNQRVWDGDGNGTAIIDIGPYEFGSPAFGGIEGVTYNPTTGDPVDYVLIKIDNQPGEFTFSDSVGSYEYKLPAGVYDVYAERVFYNDAVEYQIEVIDGQFTQFDIPMGETVEVEEHEIPHNSSLISHLSNYPNPFNPSTTISFDLPQDSNVKLNIYNIKGQIVKQLVYDQLDKGSHSVSWNGEDDSNKPVSSGLYFYKLNCGKQEKVKKMLLLK